MNALRTSSFRTVSIIVFDTEREATARLEKGLDNYLQDIGKPCQPLKGHDGPPAFKSALLTTEFFHSIGIPLLE